MAPDDISCGGCWARACSACEDCSCGGNCVPRACPCIVRDLRRLFDGHGDLLAGDEDEALDALVGVDVEDDEGCPTACLGGCPVCRPEFIVGSAAMARAYLGRD